MQEKRDVGERDQKIFYGALADEGSLDR
jgi:hypothetical protein